MIWHITYNICNIIFLYDMWHCVYYMLYYILCMHIICYIIYCIHYIIYIIYVYCTSIITESRNYNCNLELVYGSLLFCVPRETCLLTHLHHLSFSFWSFFAVLHLSFSGFFFCQSPIFCPWISFFSIQRSHMDNP